MALAFVQAKAAQVNSANLQAVMNSAPTNGNWLYAITFSSTSGTAAAAGWTQVRFTTHSSLDIGVFKKLAGAGESTTQKPATQTSGNGSVCIWEYSGSNGASTMGDNDTETAAANPPAASLTMQPPAACSVLMGAAALTSGSGSAGTISGGFTLDDTTVGATIDQVFGHLDGVAAGSATYTATMTGGGNHTCTSAALCIQAAAPDAPSPFVQFKEAVQTGGTSVSAVMDAAPTQNNLLIAIGFSGAGGMVVGSGWTQVRHNTHSSMDVGIYKKTAGAGESTTQTPFTQTSGYGVVGIWEFTGVGASTVGDNDGESSLATPPAITLTTTPTTAGVSVFGACVSGGTNGGVSGKITGGTGTWYLDSALADSGGTGNNHVFGHDSTNNTTSQAITGTLTNGPSHVADGGVVFLSLNTNQQIWPS